MAWLGDSDADGFDELLVGAPADERLPFWSTDVEGRVWIFDGGPAGSELTETQSLLGLEPGEPVGYLGTGWNADFGNVARAGDINGDGWLDLIFAAATTPGRDTTAEGAVHVYLGAAST